MSVTEVDFHLCPFCQGFILHHFFPLVTGQALYHCRIQLPRRRSRPFRTITASYDKSLSIIKYLVPLSTKTLSAASCWSPTTGSRSQWPGTSLLSTSPCRSSIRVVLGSLPHGSGSFFCGVPILALYVHCSRVKCRHKPDEPSFLSSYYLLI